MSWFQNILLFLVGIFVGGYASVVGGGALILVPFFSFINLPLAPAIATMRLGAVVQEGVSAIAFWRQRAIDWKNSLWIGVWAMFGGFLGSRITLSLDRRFLSYLIGFIMLGLLYVIPKISMKKLKINNFPKPNSIFVVLGSFLLGIYGGFYGAGFGIFLMLYFTFFVGSNIFSSAGNARVVGFLMSMSASYGFWKNNLINWEIFAPVTFGSVIGSWVGVSWAKKGGSKWIKLLLQIVVLASSIKLIVFPE